MLQVIISIIGLIIAVFVFALIADKFPSITNCIPLAIFIFVLLWGASICISYIAWWIGIIVAIVALIVYITTLIISKKPGNTGFSRDIRTEFTTDLLLSD